MLFYLLKPCTCAGERPVSSSGKATALALIFAPMLNHIQVTLHGLEQEQKELLVALLAEEGYDGFEEPGRELLAYTTETAFSETLLQQLSEQFGFTYTVSALAPQNWNAVWEAGFEPVVVDDFAAIRASFHQPVANVAHEIVITPKMSFGTGHHATTYMMIQLMRTVSCRGQKVFDFGTGTGVLAILAEQLGAAAVLAVDNDDWSISNAQENLEANHCSRVTLEKGDHADVNGRFNIILANINKHILLANMPFFREHLEPGGQLLMSGLLEQDEADIGQALDPYGLKHEKTLHRDQWIALLCSRPA